LPAAFLQGAVGGTGGGEPFRDGGIRMAAGGRSAAAGSGRRGGGGTAAATVPDAGLRESAAADAATAQLRFPASQLHRRHAG